MDSEPRVDEDIDALPAWQGDPDGVITGGHDNSTARTVAIYEGEEIPEKPLLAMFEQIIANNRAGGWRKLKK